MSPLRLAAVFLSFALAVAQPTRASEPSVQAGFQRIVTPEGLEVGIWYPARGRPSSLRLGLSEQSVIVDAEPSPGRHPLVVMSHGTGGDFAGHADTAAALARAGFVAAALTHPGDNWRDDSRATRIENRPRALSSLISYMTTARPGHALIDPERIGAFGFSAGGFTVLAAAGGRPDLSRTGPHCRAHPTYFDCRRLAAQPRSPGQSWPDSRDPRIKAIVVAAPALGFTFDHSGLADIRMPVQLWRADEDEILPAPLYADAVHDALPGPVEFRPVPGARHFDFLAPCRADAGQPILCDSADGFDRPAFHADLNRQIVRFFGEALRRPATQAQTADALQVVDRYIQAQSSFAVDRMTDLLTEDFTEISPVGDVDTRDDVLAFYARQPRPRAHDQPSRHHGRPARRQRPHRHPPRLCPAWA